MPLTDEKILVTGSSGSLGSQVIQELTDRGAKPIAMVRTSSDTRFIDSLGLEKRYADLRNKTAISEAVKGIDGIIHCAAWVDFRRNRFTQFAGINTMAAVDLFSAAKKHGARRFLHVSTVGAVGARKREPDIERAPDEDLLTEEYAFNLGHLHIPYIMTKHAAEVELRKLVDEKAPELVTVNPSIIVSPKGNDREHYEKMFDRLLMPDLPNLLNLVDVRDVAPAVVAAYERGRAGERYILGGDNVSVRDLLLRVSTIVNKSPHLVPVPRPVMNSVARLSYLWARLTAKSQVKLYPDLVRLTDYDWVYSSRKAREELSFQPRAIQTTLENFLNGSFNGTPRARVL